MEGKELEVVDEVESSAALVLNSLTKSIESGSLQPDQLSAILDAQERVLDRQAKQDFAIAMASCQSEMPEILKTDTNSQTNSRFETLGNLNKAISPVYTKNGFSVSFGTDDCPMNNNNEKGDFWLRVTADVSHCGGWVKSYHYDLPYDIAGIKGSVNKTKIHASASTLTYGRRYLLKLIFNLTTVDELDDDGAGSGAEYIDEDQLATINEWIESIGGDCLKNFKKYIEVDDLDKILAKNYKRAITALKNTAKKKKEAK
jgi:hypothetical protein